MRAWWIGIGLAAACGGGKGGPDAPGGSTIDAGPVMRPPPTCDVPPEGLRVDTSTPTTVVGTGTPAGRAIRLLQATPALIVGSVIGQPDRANHCSNGGAIGSLQASPVTIINTTIDSNEATGVGGNPGNGGNGGAIYHDGTGLALTLC